MNETLANLIRLHELTQRPEHDAGLADPREEIKRVRAELPEALLRRFDLAVEHGHVPVALLSKSGACSSCLLKLPPADALRFRLVQDQILTCPHCGCFLYSIVEHEDGAHWQEAGCTTKD